MVDGLSRSAWLTLSAAGLSAIPARLGAQAPAKMKVGLGMIEAHALGYYAYDLGLFRKAGLDVELHQLQFGAIVAEAVAAGDLQVGSSNVFSLLAGRQRGIPFVVFAPGPIFDSRDPASEELVVARNSPIRTVAELNGKVLGTISVEGQEKATISAFVDKNGGDSSTLKFVPITPNVMVPALEQGRVSAVDLPDPELSAERAHVYSLGNTFTGIANRFLVGVWFTTTGWLAQNGDSARRFSDAVVAAGQWAMAHPVDAAGILQKWVGFKEPRATMRYVTKLDPALVQPMCDVGARYKMLQPMEAGEIVWDGK